ncbi:MAG: histidine--tRNA ligase [Eubacteriales bacterium]
MKITPVKGTNDFLPSEVEIRDYLQNSIIATYRRSGFTRISTPIIEDSENLDKSDGGDNLNLIFKILKRGDKFDEAIAAYKPGESRADDLCDMGLRYDLTLPLTRYYSNNRSKLPSPFKCIQTDRVYRAERPQKGRLREFVQCDIDIIGQASYTAEIELIDTTAKALEDIDFKNFSIRINDRTLLRALIVRAGFSEESCDSVCITLDKLDKIDVAGVREELIGKGFDESSVNSLMGILADRPFTLDKVKAYLGEHPALENLTKIMDGAAALAGERYKIEYDMTLVRGQGYYTGTVFEISHPDFRGAIGGGGRYDGLVGKFLGESIPAVGFSIGFERIASIMLDSGYVIPTRRRRAAVLYTEDNFISACKRADALRTDGWDVCLCEAAKKLGKQLARLEGEGYDSYIVEGEGELKSLSRGADR